MLNICEMENYLIKNKRQTKNAYIFSFLIILPSFFVWVYWWKEVTVNMSNSIRGILKA